MLAIVLPLHIAWRYWQLAHNGADAPALVTNVKKQRSGRSWVTRYYADYVFKDEYGHGYAGRQEIDYDLYEVFRVSQPDRKTVVRYSRSNPEINAIRPDRVRNTALLFGMISVFVCGAVILIVYANRREDARIDSWLRRRPPFDNSRRASRRAGLDGR